MFNENRNASKREIMKAYRKLAVKWHPDHYEGEDKKKAERMFIDIAAAKEVLTDPGLLIFIQHMLEARCVNMYSLICLMCREKGKI